MPSFFWAPESVSNRGVPVTHQERALSSIRRQRVREGMQRLTPEEREVLEMAFYGGMTQTEIAQETGMELRTVRQLSLRAMRSLRNSQAEGRDDPTLSIPPPRDSV